MTENASKLKNRIMIVLVTCKMGMKMVLCIKVVGVFVGIVDRTEEKDASTISSPSSVFSMAWNKTAF